jgi:hypothetical protein
MKPTFKIFNSTALTPSLSLRERNQCNHRIEEIGRRMIEITEITGSDRITVNFEGGGITLHVAVEITEPSP